VHRASWGRGVHPYSGRWEAGLTRAGGWTEPASQWKEALGGAELGARHSTAGLQILHWTL
jgi:hypothetical protein